MRRESRNGWSRCFVVERGRCAPPRRTHVGPDGNSAIGGGGTWSGQVVILGAGGLLEEVVPLSLAVDIVSLSGILLYLHERPWAASRVYSLWSRHFGVHLHTAVLDCYALKYWFACLDSVT